MRLQQAIEANRARNRRREFYRRILRDVRLRIFEYEDAGKLDKAQRVLDQCLAALRSNSHEN